MAPVTWFCWTSYEKTSHVKTETPVPVAGRSMAARLVRLWARIPPGAWMSVVSVVWYQVKASATSRGVLPTVGCRCVWYRNLDKRPWPTWGGGGLLSQVKKHELRFHLLYISHDMLSGKTSSYRDFNTTHPFTIFRFTKTTLLVYGIELGRSVWVTDKFIT